MILHVVALFITLSSVFSAKLPISCDQAILRFKLRYKCVSTRREYLGRGANGIAFLIQEKNGDTKYVLKASKLKNENPEDNKSSIYIERLKDVDYVIKRHRELTTGRLYFEILDYGEHGSLDSYLNKIDTMKEQRHVLELFGKIVQGVNEIHKRGIVHADMKQENVVIDSNKQPLIIDFDLSVENGYRSGGRGTAEYMDPIILQNWGKSQTDFTPDRDKWSLGVMLYFMVFKDSPFKKSLANYEKEEILEFIKQGELFFPHNTSFPIMRVITSLLRFNEDDRIELDELINVINSYLSQGQWEFLDTDFIFNIQNSFPETIKELVQGELDENDKHIISTIFFLFFLILIVPVLMVIWFYSTRSKPDYSSQHSITKHSDDDTTDHDGPIHEFKC